jgi:chromosome segregation ATPase
MSDQTDLSVRLTELEAEEREVSTLRRKLHDRLASFPNEVTAKREQEVSARRRELHAEIDLLRAKRRLAEGRVPPT